MASWPPPTHQKMQLQAGQISLLMKHRLIRYWLKLMNQLPIPIQIGESVHL